MVVVCGQCFTFLFVGIVVVEENSPDDEFDFDSDVESSCSDDERFKLDDNIQKVIDSKELHSGDFLPVDDQIELLKR